METSQAIVLPPVQPPLYSRPEGCDCLLPRLGALAYQTIDSENGDIRLVELLPGRYSDVVQMNLHTKNLGDKPNYEALSYAWGTTPSSNRAIINGCPVPVRESLDLGLRRLRLADQPRMLWIDALCINQSDVRERSHQVQLMCRIYKSAKQVVIWLGEFPDLNSCPNSQQCQTEWIQWVESWKSGRIRTTPLLHHCQHAIEVSKLPWFRRLWIIQEFLLAFNTPDTMLGNVVTDSSSLFSALQECLGFLLRHPVTPESERKQIKQLDTHLSFLIDMFRHSMRFGPRKSLYVTSAMSQHAIATDPRDRIYGLLGITKAYVAEPILPDYSKAWPQVIAEATIVMISEDGLFPYMHADFAFPSADLFENCYRTPSWVLDFSRVMSDNCPISFSNYWGHRLSREGIERRRKSLRLSDDFRTLYKHGWYIGTTTKTFALACIPNTSGIAISQAAELYDFYHTVLKPKGIAPSRMYDALDARLGCEFHLEDFTPSLLGHRDRFLQGFEFWGTTLSHTCRFAMFLTEEGDIGLTWLHTTFEIRADDILVALFERHMPFILRPVRGDSTYRMINLACISGRSREYSRSYMLSSERMMDVPHDWVYDAAECCSDNTKSQSYMNNVMETRHYHTYTEPPHTELGRVLHSVVKSFHKRLSHSELSGTLIRLRAYDDRIRHPHGPCNPWNMLQRMGLANSYDQRKLHFEVDMPRYKKVSILHRPFSQPVYIPQERGNIYSNVNKNIVPAFMMDSFTAGDITHKNGEVTHYYEGGSKDGIPLIFIHGWPDIAESWKHQLTHFAAGGKYRVIAPDMRGYGDSTAPRKKESYALEVLIPELVEFAEQLGVKKAVWIGHDWGCLINALSAHYPELFIAQANLCVPYRSLELGLDYIKTTINRDIYPESETEWGQWEYMRYYELHPEESVKAFDGHLDVITKILYVKGDPSKWGQPSPTSRVLRDGGWFGGHPEQLPDIPLEYTSLDESLYSSLLRSKKKHGFFGANAYYLNHKANAEYAKSEKNGGVLEFPFLFIDAKLDAVCSPSTAPKMAEMQKQYVKNLTYKTIEAAHWVHLEKPKEVNETLEEWLATL